ncbi:MAG: hypothetical protein ACR2NF_06015 [Pirellulales bacterium]
MSNKKPSYVIEPCSLDDVVDLCEKYHKYGSSGVIHAYRLAVVEDSVPVAVYAWMPPAPGAAKTICPEFPQGVLSLSRMSAVPKAERRLKHISKPLRWQMKNIIDRTRYPVLVTYSDEGDPRGDGRGHNGFTYQCSGWTKTARNRVNYYEDANGNRISSYNKGGRRDGVTPVGTTVIQRWEQWACDKGDALKHATEAGWQRAPIMKKDGTPKLWRSGNQAYEWINNRSK